MIDVTHGRYWDESISPVTGCTPVGPGCAKCWAAAMVRRFPRLNHEDPFGTVNYSLAPLLKLALRKRPKVVAMSWLGDLLHPDVPDAFLACLLGAVAATPRHTFIVLTKRASRLATISKWSLPPMWWGVSAWDNLSTMAAARALEAFGRVSGARTFLSLEPLLGPVSLLSILKPPYPGQVLAGGETGPGARPCYPAWLRAIRDDCSALRIPFFLKQNGTHQRAPFSRVLDGRTHDDLAWHRQPGGAA
jgi:protein gp37